MPGVFKIFPTALMTVYRVTVFWI
uniref:Uncharacterized protein n=1 Tax=Anguilla anguilla TaxID=7936 RepID=A0A0E9VUL7_ANGAN